tara:strand:- start:3 stop:356 length:354 start_codon:yes stop_codon:yes gene_type:complete
MNLEFTIERAINTIKKTWPKGISGGRLKEENPELYERVVLEGDKNKLQYARSGLKWSVLKNKYDSALDAVKDIYQNISRGQLIKKNPSLYMKIKREGNLNKLPYAYKHKGKYGTLTK